MAKGKKATKVEEPVVKAVKGKKLVDSSSSLKMLAIKYFGGRTARQKAMSAALKAKK